MLGLVTTKGQVLIITLTKAALELTKKLVRNYWETVVKDVAVRLTKTSLTVGVLIIEITIVLTTTFPT